MVSIQLSGQVIQFADVPCEKDTNKGCRYMVEGIYGNPEVGQVLLENPTIFSVLFPC